MKGFDYHTKISIDGAELSYTGKNDQSLRNVERVLRYLSGSAADGLQNLKRELKKQIKTTKHKDSLQLKLNMLQTVEKELKQAKTEQNLRFKPKKTHFFPKNAWLFQKLCVSLRKVYSYV